MRHTLKLLVEETQEHGLSFEIQRFLDEMIMKTAMRKFGVAAILMACMMNAFAKHGNRGDEREVTQAERQQLWAQDLVARRDGDERPQQGERRGGDDRQYRQQEGRTAYPSEQSGANAEEQRRGSKMSPEERRALRRQINEAGRDLYAPGR